MRVASRETALIRIIITSREQKAVGVRGRGGRGREERGAKNAGAILKRVDPARRLLWAFFAWDERKIAKIIPLNFQGGSALIGSAITNALTRHRAKWTVRRDVS